MHNRIHNLRKRTSIEVDESKIIIAIEPKNLLFNISLKKEAGYKEVNLSLTGWDWLWSCLMRFFGKGLYYCPRESKRSALQFLKSLNQHSDVVLFLYTTLSLQVVEAILLDMDLLHYFP